MTEHPELFWAIRGGGGNFGIVTRFDHQLHPIGPEVFIVGALYSLADAEQVTPAWCDFALQAPDEITSTLVYWSLPSLPAFPAELHGTPIVGAFGLYAGDATEGEATCAIWAALSAASLTTPPPMATVTPRSTSASTPPGATRWTTNE